MKFKNKTFQGFTLIEVLVSITILSIILISVFAIYISSSDISLKTDITRALQQNVKSSVERMAEDIRKNGFDCVRSSYGDPCVSPNINETNTGSILEIDGNIYYLAQKSGTTYVSVDRELCDEVDEKCTLVLNGQPIMNSWVDVKDIQFLASDTLVKKVTIVMTLQPAIGKGIKPDLVKNNRFNFQTTISERSTLN